MKQKPLDFTHIRTTPEPALTARNLIATKPKGPPPLPAPILPFESPAFMAMIRDALWGKPNA